LISFAQLEALEEIIIIAGMGAKSRKRRTEADRLQELLCLCIAKPSMNIQQSQKG